MLLPDPPSTPGPRLPRVFFERDTVAVARALLGQLLVRRLPDGTRLSGLIVETEAYLGPDDRAAHTSAGRRTPRNESMWQRGGTCYVYFTYGMHHCMNVVTGDERTPQAVLLRALQPVEGQEAMRIRRPVAKRDTDLCSGPAKLCAALGVDRALDSGDLIDSDTLWLERARRRALPAPAVGVGPRVGVAYAGEWAGRPLRFTVRGNPHVSRRQGFPKPRRAGLARPGQAE